MATRIDDRYGLNKAARLQAKREKALAEKRKLEAQPLDALFPYETVDFDAGFFGVESSGKDEG
jgi:hypothetical protein